ncbi:MAG: glycosyltransferase family 4 protein [Trichlorobacter sp.]
MKTSFHTHPLMVLLVRLGAGLGRLLPVRNRSGLFFFFPFYHTGGAEKVHAEIVNCFTAERPWVFFVKRSRDRQFWQQFTVAARCFDCGWLLKYTYPFSAGILAGLIGRHANARVFGCNALFYYLLLPYLPPTVRATDLLHGLGGGAEQFALPVLDRLDQRVVISDWVKGELLNFYRKNGIVPSFDEKVTIIPNRVMVPTEQPSKPHDGPIQILFVGRGSEEKRIHLIGRAARRCVEKEINVSFTLVGDLDQWLEDGDAAYCSCTGGISDFAVLQALYATSHLVVIVSSREGFPLTIMEGMAQGCVPVCTAVGGIPEHIRHLENGWLLPAGDEQAVVKALFDAVVYLAGNRHQLAGLSSAAACYARDRFAGQRFCQQYRQVIQR